MASQEVLPGWKGGIASTFISAKQAFDAVHNLHDVGLMRTWVGFYKTSCGEGGSPVLDTEWEGDSREAHGMFAMTDGSMRSLFDCLRQRGVAAAAAFRLSRTGPRQGIVVVVSEQSRAREAERIMADCGGLLLTD